jgi:tetratricopeptide (TPR) repeat protein
MRARIFLLIAALLLMSALAFAKGKAEAKEAFNRALQYYNLSDFKSALQGFKEAYLDYPDPSFLFNIGQCQRQLGDKPAALLSYKAYLREAPAPPNRAEVATLVHNLEQRIHDDEIARQARPESAQVAPATPTTAVPTPVVTAPAASLTATRAPSPADKPVYKKWWLWTTVAVVVVGAGVGLGVGLGLSSATHFPSASSTDGSIRF